MTAEEPSPSPEFSEASPLLGGQAIVRAEADHSHDERDEDRPLPVKQVLLLCFARMAEPIVFFSIFPFVQDMVKDNGNVPVSDVGFYSGLIESLLSLTQMIFMVPWGRAADRFGRKPVLVFSMVGFTATTILFGFAHTIAEMIIYRSVAGLFGGTIVTVRTMITEHSTSKTQARAFSWFAFANNVGLFVGPLLGGVLADPVKQYGGVFADIQFFHDYPYALPTLTTGAFSALATVVVALCVTETMPKAHVNAPPPMSTLDLVRAPGVPMVLFLYGHVMLLAFGYTAVNPVFWFTPVELGGFGFTELLISIFMCMVGVAQAIWILLVFPPLQQRIGTGGVLRGCGVAYPLFFAVCPLLNAMLRAGGAAIRPTFFAVGSIALVLGVGVSMAFTAVQLALNDVAPAPQTLGTLNALALALISGLRAFAPVVFNSIFAVGVRDQILGGYLAWAVLIALAALFGLATFWLPPQAEGKLARDD